MRILVIAGSERGDEHKNRDKGRRLRFGDGVRPENRGGPRQEDSREISGSQVFPSRYLIIFKSLNVILKSLLNHYSHTFQTYSILKLQISKGEDFSSDL